MEDLAAQLKYLKSANGTSMNFLAVKTPSQF